MHKLLTDKVTSAKECLVRIKQDRKRIERIAEKVQTLKQKNALTPQERTKLAVLRHNAELDYYHAEREAGSLNEYLSGAAQLIKQHNITLSKGDYNVIDKLKKDFQSQMRACREMQHTIQNN